MTLARFEHATRQILHRLRTARNVGTDSSSEKPPGDTHLKSTSSNPTRDRGTGEQPRRSLQIAQLYRRKLRQHRFHFPARHVQVLQENDITYFTVGFDCKEIYILGGFSTDS